MRKLAATIAFLVFACGGKSAGPRGPGGGEGAPDAGVPSAWGGGAPDSAMSGDWEPDAGVPDAAPGAELQPGEVPPSDAQVMFALENQGDSDLIFAIDKGWQPVLFAYSGKPPRARSILLFPQHCTNSCEAAVEEMCPVCKMEEEDFKKRRQQEIEETRRRVVPPGGVTQVGWDGLVYVYERAPKAARTTRDTRGCRCWRKAPPAPNTYTVKACGLRPAAKVGEPSRPVCAETQMVLPPEPGAEPGPAVVRLVFPAK